MINDSTAVWNELSEWVFALRKALLNASETLTSPVQHSKQSFYRKPAQCILEQIYNKL